MTHGDPLPGWRTVKLNEVAFSTHEHGRYLTTSNTQETASGNTVTFKRRNRSISWNPLERILSNELQEMSIVIRNMSLSGFFFAKKED